MFKANISRNIKKLRRKNAWSQEMLARKAGISYNTLIKIESGKIKNPTIGTIIKLAKAFKVNINRLIS